MRLHRLEQGDQPALVRVHRIDFLSDFLGEAGKREGLVKRSMERLAASEEPGVAVFVRMGMGEEIARALGRSEGATKVLIHRAIRQLEQGLNQEEEPDE